MKRHEANETRAERLEHSKCLIEVGIKEMLRDRGRTTMIPRERRYVVLYVERIR